MKDRPTLRKQADHGGVSRRDALIISAAALGSSVGAFGCIARLRARRQLRMRPRATGCLSSATSNIRRLQAFRLRQSERAEGGTFSQLGSVPAVQPELPHLQQPQSLILKGDGALGIDQTFASLMAPSTIFSPAHDEPDAVYGLVARACRYRWMD